jgi:hypothetical protein
LAVQIRRFRDAMFRHFRHFVGDLVSRFRRRRCRFSTVEDFYYAAASISRHVLNRACAGGTRHSDVTGCGKVGACASPIQLNVRLLVVRVRNASDDDGVDRGLVSYEAEYFASDGIPRRPGTGAVLQITRLVTHNLTGNLRSKNIAAPFAMLDRMDSSPLIAP